MASDSHLKTRVHTAQGAGKAGLLVSQEVPPVLARSLQTWEKGASVLDEQGRSVGLSR